MKYISEFEIKNFRGFDYLKLSDLGKINILFGKNNCGKSSILEAILLTQYNLLNISDASNFNNIRNDELKYLFNNFNISEHIEFKVHTKLKTYVTRFIPNKNGNNLVSISIQGNQNIFTPILVPKLSQIETYKEIIIKRRDKKLLEFIKNLDSRVEIIHILDDKIYFGLKNMKELIPIKLMGDGIKYIFNILSSIINGNSIILIDEIENGLYYLAHRELWSSIMKLQEEFEFQMFITTHSLETLKALKEVLEDEKNKNMRSEVKAINIVHTKKAGIKAYNYDFESLREMIDTETEIR